MDCYEELYIAPAKPASAGLIFRPEASHNYRFTELARVLEALIEYAPEKFVGRTLKIAFHDAPPDLSIDDNPEVLTMCTTKWLGQESKFIPLPCPYVLGWTEIGLPDALSMMAEFSNHDRPPRSNRLLWRGAATHPSRNQLVATASRRLDLCDVQMIAWDRTDPANLRALNQVMLPDHINYRYLVDAPGEGYSARLKWLLATGRPVFIIERPAVEHWHDCLIPWEDYIPVAADSSDLLSRLEWLDSKPVLAEMIGRRAKDFARQHLTLNAHFQRTVDAIAQRDRLRIAKRMVTKPSLAVEDPQKFAPTAVTGKAFLYARIFPLWGPCGYQAEPIAKLTLAPGGVVAGYSNPNERSWEFIGDSLQFKNDRGFPSTSFESIQNDIIYGRQNTPPLGVALIPDAPMAASTKTIVVVASCLHYYKITVPRVILQLVASGFSLSEIKVVINAAPTRKMEQCFGVDCFFTLHRAFEFSAFYEAPEIWIFDYALIIPDTVTVHSGCYRCLRNLNGALMWDGYSGVTGAQFGVAVVSRKFLQQIRHRLAELDNISKLGIVTFQVLGGIWRYSRGPILSVQTAAEETAMEAITAGGHPRRTFYLRHLEISKHINWDGICRDDYDQL